MKNFVQQGDTLSVTAPAAVLSGVGVLVGAIFGVTQNAAASGAPVLVAREGVFDLTKVEAQAWAEGVKVYWDNAAKNVTTTSAGNTLIGAAAEAALNPSTVGRVLLDGVIR